MLAASLFSTLAACATEDDLAPDDSDTQTDTAELAKPNKKWHPGHYLNAGRKADPNWFFSITTQYPFLAGAAFVHTWRELEPQRGKYDFTRIRAELAVAKAKQKRVIIHIWDKTFLASLPDCVPDYVKAGSQYLGGQVVARTTDGRFRGCTALRWVPAVQDRLIALYQALGREFDGDANFEAVMLQEDSIISGGIHHPTYTKRAYADQQKRGMTALARAFPHTQAFKFLNWGPFIGELVAHGHALGLGMGTPDILPGHPSWSYPFYPQFAGKMPLQASMQWPGPRNYMLAGEMTIEDIYEFAVFRPDGLHANYVIWDQPSESALSFWRQIVPMLQAHNAAINTGCPSNITCN